MIVNLETFSDADLVQSFIYQTPLGAPIDLGTDTLRMMVRSRADDATVYIESATWNGEIIVTNAALGAFTLVIPIARLVLLTPGIYVHSLIKTASVGLLRKELWRGTLTHAAGPTRWRLGTP